MPADPRDQRKPLTPPPHVRAQTAAPVEVDFGDKTNPHAPLLEQVDHRTKRISTTAESTLLRLDGFEGRLNAQDKEIGLVKTDAAYTRGKIDAIADNAVAQLAERAAKREHDLRREKIRQTAKLVGAMFGGLAAVIAGIVALVQVLR